MKTVERICMGMLGLFGGAFICIFQGISVGMLDLILRDDPIQARKYIISDYIDGLIPVAWLVLLIIITIIAARKRKMGWLRLAVIPYFIIEVLLVVDGFPRIGEGYDSTTLHVVLCRLIYVATRAVLFSWLVIGRKSEGSLWDRWFE